MTMSLAALRASYAEGTAPAEIVRAIYARIQAIDDSGIFIHLRPETDLLAEAEALGNHDPARPLWGIPFAVKDNIDVAGLPTTAACPAFSYIATETAFAVQRLLDAGALLVGKTNLDQFATGLVGVRTPYPVPRNAADPTLVPGGSSSGSAVAVAQGIVAFALGTDTAGSGRVPAALNGLVGLKPSIGLVSTRGVVPACRTLDCVSIFTGSVADAWAVLEVAGCYDAAEPFARDLPLASSALPPRLRLGVPRLKDLAFFGDEAAEAAFAAHLERVRALATEIVEIDLRPFLATAELLYGGPWVAERDAAIGPMLDRDSAALHPVTRKIVEGARGFSATDAFRGRYRLAELARETAPVWKRIDAILVPTIPRVYTLAEVAAEPFRENARLGTYTNFVNLLDLAALAVPGTPRPDGRPAGITFIAPAGKDGLLAAIGQAFTTGEAPAVTAPPGWIPLAVVGAHLSGLPLNHELTGRGAVLLRAVSTAPDYRFWALPGGPPFRPGLVRVAPGTGASIATEVWALPPEGFASFVAGIPSPLGIGTLRLADGSTVKGFLCEPIGTEGGSDISHHGGWRAYLASKAT